MKGTQDNNLPVVKKLDREEIILTKHYFEHGDLPAAMKAAGYKPEALNSVRNMLINADSHVCQFYMELCRDRVASTCISAEKKRIKLWKLAEWSIKENEEGKPNDCRLALACIDMLNRMDGDYAAMQINTKQQIQKQTVSFSQKIHRPNDGITTNRALSSKKEIDEQLIVHKDVVEA